MLKVTAILALVICGCAFGQTTPPTQITGPLYDPSGTLSTCGLRISPLTVPQSGPANIAYQAIAGDLAGTTGGYGSSVLAITRHQPLALYFGTYRVIVECAATTYGSRTYIWNVPPNGTFDIGRLNTGQGRGLGEIPNTLGNTDGTLGVQ